MVTMNAPMKANIMPISRPREDGGVYFTSFGLMVMVAGGSGQSLSLQSCLFRDRYGYDSLEVHGGEVESVES